MATDQVATDAGSSLEGRFLLTTLIGAAVGTVLGGILAVLFFPVYFLGIMGGGFCSGFLYKRGAGSGALIGGVAGVAMTVPFAVLLVAVLVVGIGGVLATTPIPADDPRGRGLFAAYGTLSIFLVIVALFANGISGLIGGVVGGAVAE